MAKEFARSACTALGIAALVMTATTIDAQVTNTIESPQLRDFQLPGTRTVPAQPPQQQPEQQTPTTITPPVTPPAPVATPPAQRTPPATTPPTQETQRRPAEPAPRPQATGPRTQTPAPAITAPVAPEPAPEGVPAPVDLQQALPTPAPVAPPVVIQSAPHPAEPGQSFPWLYLAGAGLLLLLAALAFIGFRRSRASAEDRSEPVYGQAEEQSAVTHEPDPLFARQANPEPVPAAAPAPAAPPPAAPVADDFVSVSLRPRIVLEFTPDRAAATLTDTSVQFELTIRNVGSRTAWDIRIQVHMNNAGPEQDRELDEFYGQPLPRDVAPAIAEIPPGSEAKIRTGITLPKERVRELIVQGRQLFIPVVAFNVFYEWENGRTGQTSMSYIVGRQAPTPQEKMGAFRLDLGPRLYRSVAQRQGHLAKVV